MLIFLYYVYDYDYDCFYMIMVVILLNKFNIVMIIIQIIRLFVNALN